VREFAALKPNELPTLTEEQLHVIEKIDEASENAETPLQRLEHKLQPLVMFGVMPHLAMANARGELPDDMGAARASSVTLGVGLGLLLGKPLGILLTCWIFVRLGPHRTGAHLEPSRRCRLSCRGGLHQVAVRFVSPLLRQQAKLGILVASVLAGTIGFLLLRRSPPVTEGADGE
jgi:NhaA family Na+:H+ antiporter